MRFSATVPGCQAVLKDEANDLVVAAAARLAARHAIHLHIGSTAIARPDGKIANRAFLFGPDGSRIARYDKIHMFDVDLANGESWRELAVYQPGSETVVAGLPFAESGALDLLRPALSAAVPGPGARPAHPC